MAGRLDGAKIFESTPNCSFCISRRSCGSMLFGTSTNSSISWSGSIRRVLRDVGSNSACGGKGGSPLLSCRSLLYSPNRASWGSFSSSRHVISFMLPMGASVVTPMLDGAIHCVQRQMLQLPAMFSQDIIHLAPMKPREANASVSPFY